MSEEWTGKPGMDRASYEDLETLCASLLDENASLKRKLAEAGGVKVIDFDGKRIFVHEDGPPIVWDANGVYELKATAGQ